MFDLHFIKDLGGKLMGRQFVFRGPTAKFQTHLRLCPAFTLLCHSNSFFIIADMALGFSLVALWGMGKGISAIRCFSGLGFLFLGWLCLIFACVLSIFGNVSKKWHISNGVLYVLVFAMPQVCTRWLKRKQIILVDTFPSCNTLYHGASYAWQMNKWIDMLVYDTAKPVHFYSFLRMHPQ